MALSKSKAVYQYDLDFKKTSYGYKWRFKEGEIEC